MRVIHLYEQKIDHYQIFNVIELHLLTFNSKKTPSLERNETLESNETRICSRCKIQI